MMKCKVCGDVTQKDPLSSEEFALITIVSAIAAVLIVLTLVVGSCTWINDYTLMKTIENPSMKVEINEYDGGGKVLKKITR